MFHILRRAAQTWVAKLLMLLLVASFGIWGVSRSLITGSNSTTVVTVGDQHVDVNEFHLAYQRQVASVSQQFGTRLTPSRPAPSASSSRCSPSSSPAPRSTSSPKT